MRKRTKNNITFEVLFDIQTGQTLHIQTKTKQDEEQASSSSSSCCSRSVSDCFRDVYSASGSSSFL